MFHFCVKITLSCREADQFVKIILTYTVLATSVAVICKFYTRAFCSTMQTQGRRRMGSMASYDGTLQACWQPENHTYGKANQTTVP